MCKKVLLVTRVSGFVPQFEMNNVKILQKMGYEVHYASNFETVVYGADNERLKGTGIVCHDMPFCRSPFSGKVLTAYRKLKQLLLEEEFELIHCHMPMTGVVTRMAAQAVRRQTKREVPVIYTTHGFHFFRGAPLKNWLYYLPEKWLARYTDRLITINEEDFQRASGFKVRGKVEKIPGVGIENHKEDLGEERRSSIREQKREELGVSASDYMLLSVGELNHNKNHLQVIKALAETRDASIRYFICGMGALHKELEEQVKKFGLEKQVRLLGYRSDIKELLLTADCFVFPSLREGLSVALMEAMRAGLPVVAKKIRGNVDLLADGQGGFLLKEGTPQEYMEAVYRVKNDKDLAVSMGKWNQERVRKFSCEEVTARMERIYKEVLE